MSQPVRIKSDVAARVNERAVEERRSFANMVEVLLLEALGGAALTERPVAGASSAGRSVTAAVSRVVHDVPMRPHMRKDRPALQCDGRVVVGEVCSVCGGVG